MELTRRLQVVIAQLWVADATYVPTWTGTIYLAVALDVWSHKIVGWAIEDHLRTELMLEALNMALAQRQPSKVIHHSDHGNTRATRLANAVRK